MFHLIPGRTQASFVPGFAITANDSATGVVAVLPGGRHNHDQRIPGLLPVLPGTDYRNQGRLCDRRVAAD